ncbi:MAG: Rrf2 family transcriptional regulator [Sedimentisphaerales bacterium]|nr:Rrf2 family transcriptional regulator [Sedimentisphaerales bacterium]
MNLFRQNTDYALRVMVNLAQRWPGRAVSARVLAQEGEVSNQFTCKILQQLHEANLLISCMGPKGGYRLSRPPAAITMLDVICAVQGPICVNKCMVGPDGCPRQHHCFISLKVAELQNTIENYLDNVTLDELAHRSVSLSEVNVNLNASDRFAAEG